MPMNPRLCRLPSSLHSSPKILSIANASVFRFGDGNSAKPIFQNLTWSIHDGESWAVVGSNSKNAIIELLTGHLRIAPSTPGGIYPFLNGRDIHECVSLVSFATRLKSSGGGFYDFTARYGALREEDTLTLRNTLPEVENEKLTTLAQQLELDTLLDLPLVALSNGQTRRARILNALLKTPKLLILDEPFTGLDTHHRPLLGSLLKNLHSARSPRVIASFRPQDPLPEWFTHVFCISKDGSPQLGTLEEMRPVIGRMQATSPNLASISSSSHTVFAEEFVSMKDVKVSYHDRHVLKSVDWTVHAGDRWHLQGANGSGKTTLTSLLNGTHPQSYTQAHLHLFSKPRSEQATVILQRLIGHVSPELFNAFPRRLGSGALSVRDTIASGFDGTFVYRKRTHEEDAAVEKLASAFGVNSTSVGCPQKEWLDKPFTLLHPGEQSLALLLRALVAKPKLLILDEAFAGMDENMVEMSRRYLRNSLGDDQAVVFVGHWESEIPWSISDGLKILRIQNGIATHVQS